MTRLLKDLSRPDRHRPGPTYREVGATRTPEALPEGYHHLRYGTVVGHGRTAFATAGTAVTTCRMHRPSGGGLVAVADRAGPGARV
ncbi:DUF1990 family protein, partial [Streptomyces sp. NPDC006324]|uniref:DUF1990 family protein n=1 Tax=Streptomyces sp. NPDC006324 TaxID=3156751 RepID=UPI0033B632D6